MPVSIARDIVEISSRLPESRAILLYLSVVLEGEHAPYLLQFLPEDDYQQLSGSLEMIQSHSERDLRFPLLDEVHRLSHQKPYQGVHEMDGSWILHYLKQEKPAVIGLILKHLPADKVYQILNRLDPELRSQLPESDALDRVPDEVIDIVRRRFERQLVHFQKPRQSRKLNFSCVRSLSGHDLKTLIRDLGVDILSLAFQGVNERSLIELVKNLDEEDAEFLFEKFNQHRSANRGDIKAAQLEILGLSLSFDGGSDLIMEAGVQRLARAMTSAYEDMIVVLQHKLPMKSGYQFKRYVDDYRNDQHPESVALKLQELIVLRIYELSKSGQIDEHWSKIPRSKKIKVH